MTALKHSLTARLAGYFLLLSLVTVSIVGVLAFVQARRELQNLVFGQLSVASVVKREELQRWVAEQHEFVDFLVKTPELRGRVTALTNEANPEEALAARMAVALYLRGIVGTRLDLQEIVLLDTRDGKILVSTSSEYEGLIQEQAPYFVEGRKEIYLQPAYLSPLSGKPTITIAAPLMDDSGGRRAVIAVHLNLEQLDAFLLDSTGLGKTGEAYLVGRFNGFVSSRRFGRVPLSQGLETVGIGSALRGFPGSGLYKNYAGIPVIGVYTWIPEEELALIVEMHQSEAFAPAQRLAATILLVGGLCAGLLTAAVLLLARSITRPLVALTATATRLADGDLSQMAPVLTEDETGLLAQAFNQMTEKLRLLYGDLQRREEHFRSLIEHTSDVILVVDRESLIRYDGPSIERVLGYSHRFLRGQRLTAFLDAADTPVLLDELVASFDDPERTLAIEFRFRHASGRWRVLEGRGQFLQDHEGLPGIVINARDISERKRAEEERVRLQEESLRVRSEFIATVSHELRTPLTPIRGYADILLLGAAGPLTEEQVNFVEVIKSNTIRMGSLVDDLLDIGKIQAGKIVLNYERIDVRVLLLQEITMLRPQSERKNLELELDLADDLPPLHADGKRVRQIFVNLLSNAIKYTPAGGRIWVRAFQLDDQYVELQVADTGVGLTPEQQQKLFTPFYRADNGLHTEVGGTGLGLCIVKSFVELHGGMVSVDSAAGEGSVFAVTLPFQRNEEPELPGEELMLQRNAT